MHVDVVTVSRSELGYCPTGAVDNRGPMVGVRVITIPMAHCVIVSCQGAMFDNARERVDCPFFEMGADDISNRRFREEVIEAVPLVRYDKKILTAILKECGDLGQVTNKVWLVFDAVDANRSSKSLLNPREVACLGYVIDVWCVDDRIANALRSLDQPHSVKHIAISDVWTADYRIAERADFEH
jgi:hypothetical protein